MHPKTNSLRHPNTPTQLGKFAAHTLKNTDSHTHIHSQRNELLYFTPHAWKVKHFLVIYITELPCDVRFMHSFQILPILLYKDFFA